MLPSDNSSGLTPADLELAQKAADELQRTLNAIVRTVAAEIDKDTDLGSELER